MAKSLKDGAGDRDRTGTGLLSPRDFKSLASAYSATPARAETLTYCQALATIFVVDWWDCSKAFS